MSFCLWYNLVAVIIRLLNMTLSQLIKYYHTMFIKRWRKLKLLIPRIYTRVQNILLTNPIITINIFVIKISNNTLFKRTYYQFRKYKIFSIRINSFKFGIIQIKNLFFHFKTYSNANEIKTRIVCIIYKVFEKIIYLLCFQ